MLNVDQKNRLHNTVSEMAELVLIKSFITKKKQTKPTTNNKPTQPQAKTSKVKRDRKQSFVTENIKQFWSLGVLWLQWITHFLTSAIQYCKKSSLRISSLFPSFPKQLMKERYPHCLTSSEWQVIFWCSTSNNAIFSTSHLCRSIKGAFWVWMCPVLCQLHYFSSHTASWRCTGVFCSGRARGTLLGAELNISADVLWTEFLLFWISRTAF